VPSALPIDNVHLRCCVIPHQIGDEAFCVRTSSCDERKPTARIPAGEALNLADAETAITIVDDQIGVWTFIRRRQWGLLGVSDHQVITAVKASG
jgi:hypothetical protein